MLVFRKILKTEYNPDNTHAAMLREESRSHWKLCTVLLSYIYTASKLSHHIEVTETGFYIILCYVSNFQYYIIL